MSRAMRARSTAAARALGLVVFPDFGRDLALIISAGR
jgi:hypothetical protein